MAWRRVLIGAAVVIGCGVFVAPVAGAGDVAPSQDVLDALREAIPEGAPGEFDLEEGDGIFGELVENYGALAQTSDFGDGSSLTGLCGGMALSYGSNGQLIDAAIDVGDDAPPIDLLEGGQAFTAGNRFRVDTGGLVAYFGFFPEEGDGPRDHRWEIVTGGISIDSGGDPNPQGKNRNAGIVDLAEQLPFEFNANVRIEGEMFSSLPPCIGNGHVAFRASGISPLQVGGVVGLFGGVFGLLFNARPAMTWKA